jgi:hypothetical protein
MPELVFQFSCFDKLLPFKTDWYQLLGLPFNVWPAKVYLIRLSFRPARALDNFSAQTLVEYEGGYSQIHTIMQNSEVFFCSPQRIVC